MVEAFVAIAIALSMMREAIKLAKVIFAWLSQNRHSQ